MATVGNISAALQPSNVGIGAKTLDPKLIKGALIVPKGFVITNANLSTLLSVLQSAAYNDSKGSRLYPVANLVDFKDNSEKAVVQTFGYGGQKTVRDGIYKWSFQFVKGGKTLNDALRTFNGDNWDFFFVDHNNVLFGKQYVDTNGAAGIKAIPSIEIYTNPFGLNDGKKVAEYMVEFVFDPKYLNELGQFIADAGFDILDNVTGLQDVVLTGVADATSGTYDITVATKLGVNLFGQYGNNAGLAQSACFVATNAATGAAIPITSVTPNAGGQYLAIVVDKTNTNYPTVSGAKVQFNLVGPTALNTAGVAGFESTGAIQIVKN